MVGKRRQSKGVLLAKLLPESELSVIFRTCWVRQYAGFRAKRPCPLDRKASSIPSLLSVFSERRVRRNIWALLKTQLLISGVVLVFSALFRFLMVYAEGQTYSWITSIYWTLTTMSTVGYGDIVFESELGRVFSVVVLVVGIMLIFIVMPFTFLRFFYAPWLEAQIRRRTPRQVPTSTREHVIICTFGNIAESVIERLERDRIPYFVIEADQDKASNHYFAGISVVMGEVDNKETYEALRVDQARLVFANADDALNTNITLTVREVSETVPIVAIAHEESAVDILQHSGATRVLPLNRWLGEQLANRVNAAHTQLHVIGHYRDLMIAELPVHHTPLVGKTIRETNLRENIGVSIVGVWERGRLLSAHPERQLTASSVPVVAGTEDQLEELNFLFGIYDVNESPVLVIGGGTVGVAAARALRRKEIPVHLVERDGALVDQLCTVCQQVFTGDAANPDVLRQAGLYKAPSVLLTTNDDALNIYLTSLCRQLNPELRIVSRIAHERNLEAIHRAGADFVLGTASLGVEATFSILKGQELIILGEGIDLFSVPVPDKLNGKTLAESSIGARTGLNVIAVQQNGDYITSPPASMTLILGAELLMFGDTQQRRQFVDLFGK